MRRLAAILLACAVMSACGDIHVRSIRVPESVPDRLQGEWTGAWHSTRDGSGGTVVLRMQDFGGEPVVSIVLANPCVEAREYTFRTEGNMVELLADQEVLFSAILGTDRTLTGSYQCDADAGLWTAAWAAELPPLVDVGGRWEGSLAIPSFPPQPFVMDIALEVVGGALTVGGSVQVPTVMTSALPVVGVVMFHDTTFDVWLEVPTGTANNPQLFGVGDLASMRITTGLLQANGNPLLPFVQAGWTALRTAP